MNRVENAILNLAVSLVCLAASSLTAQVTDSEAFYAEQLTDPVSQPAPASKHWWSDVVSNQMFEGTSPVEVDLNRLLVLALQSSEQLKVYSETPLIRETAVTEAEAAFDWAKYLNGVWEDIDVPVGSSLTVGGNASRFEDHNLGATAGLRRKTLTGAEIDISQRIGHQNTNSNFFIPNDQGTAELAVSIRVPLLRGRGRIYNSSLQCLACIDTDTARTEFQRQLQSHLLEVIRAYWALYLERAASAQKVRLTEATKEILSRIQSRRTLDANPVQLKAVQAALSNREADLIRAATAIRNAEERVRALINDSELGTDESIELVPLQMPSLARFDADVFSQMETALQNRPEILVATQEIKAAAIRRNMSKHEILPVLDLVTRTYLSGLRGESNIGRAWTDQFDTGRPSYTIGLQYELPIGNRAARARHARRRLEQRQFESQYRLTMENIRAEVAVAVREILTAFQEIESRQLSVTAAQSEVAALEYRWNEMIGEEGTSSLNLESLLRSQQRLADMQFALVRAQLTYNLALANLNVANGSLLETEQVAVGRANECGLSRTILSKGIQ